MAKVSAVKLLQNITRASGRTDSGNQEGKLNLSAMSHFQSVAIDQIYRWKVWADQHVHHIMQTQREYICQVSPQRHLELVVGKHQLVCDCVKSMMCNWD